MALLLTDVRNYLVEEGLVETGGDPSWDCWCGYLPPSPDAGIAIFETSGAVPETKKSGSTETEYDEPHFQVRGRGEKFGLETLREKMGAIYRALHDSTLSPSTGDPAYVFVFALQSAPFSLGLDDSQRPGMTWNFKALRERET